MEQKKTKKPMSRKTQRILISVLVGLLLAVFLFSGYKLYSIAREYRAARHSYDKLSGSVVTGTDPASLPELPGGTDPQTGAEPAGPSPITVDFAALQAQSTDVKGWLFSADTVINYPVMQAGSDKPDDYYLHRLPDGSYNASGSLFLDVRCPGDFSGRISIIYGHRMKDGSMFASLGDYKDQAYYDAHPVMYLNTPDGNYRVDLFSAFITASDSALYVSGFESDEAYQAYLLKVKAFSDFRCDVTPTVDDRIVMFSTCTYEYNEARFLVYGVLTPVE